MKRKAKLLFFMLIGPGSVIVYLPYLLLSYFGQTGFIKSGQFQYIGIIPILAGSAISLWCFYSFLTLGQGTPVPNDPPKKLVVLGLYRFVRNPMYVGILILLFGEALFLNHTYYWGMWYVSFVYSYLFSKRADPLDA